MVDTGVCPDCITGAIHEGVPKGSVSTIAKLPTYIAKPTSMPGKPGVIVIAPDVFGWNFANNRLLADEYAERSGHTVYLPDFMFGMIFPIFREWEIILLQVTFLIINLSISPIPSMGLNLACSRKCIPPWLYERLTY